MEEKKVKQEQVRKVFLDELPKNKGEKVDWLKCKNYRVRFIYDDIQGWIEIADVKRENSRTILYLKYLDNDIFKMFTGHFAKCKLKELLGLINHEYNYNIEEIIKDKKRNLLILKQYHKKEYRYYKYKCLNCGYFGDISEGNLNEGKNCSVCSHNKVEKDINSIWATDNELVKYFVNEHESYKYQHYSEHIIEVICPDCRTIREISIASLYGNGFTCPKCGDGISMPNKIMFNILEQLIGVNAFKREHSPDWIGRRLYDFYFKLNNKEYIIEMDGGLGHGKTDNLMNGITKEESKAIDDYKDEQAKLHDIEVIRIDCDPSKFEYIKQNILANKELNRIFDLSIIDWKLVSKAIITNKMKEACDLWNNGYKIKEISDIYKIGESTIRRYLKNGTALNMCLYDGQKELSESVSRKVKCIEYNLDFNSITECAEELSNMLNIKFNIGNISQVCKGNRKTHNKLHFEYL